MEGELHEMKLILADFFSKFNFFLRPVTELQGFEPRNGFNPCDLNSC